MKKRIFALILTLMLLISCLAACGGDKVTDSNLTNGDVTVEDGNNDSSEVPTLTEKDNGDADPFFKSFTTTTIDGEEVSEKIFTGNKLTMVNVWGTFCSPCINEMPDIEKLSKDYADKGVVVIGIVSDVYDYIKAENNADKIKDAESIIAQTGVTYTNLLPSVSLNQVRLNYINTFPTTYFLNEKGEIITSEYIGSRTYDQWANIIDSLLQAL